MTFPRRLLLAALALALAAPAVRAQDAVLKELSGKVLVKAKGKRTFVPAAAGDGVSFGDQVETLRGAVVHVVFNDGAAVLVKENSLFGLQGSARRTVLGFPFGEFLIGLKRKLADKESFKVQTPTAVAAVRGTLFWGKSDVDEGTDYACFASTISITAQGKTIDLLPGQKTHIAAGQPPEEPSPSAVPLSYLDTFTVNGSLQGLKDLAETGR